MKIKSGLLFTACSFIIACNGENQQPIAPHYSTSVFGKVMDEPLSNAKVCFDINNNMHCDNQEPTTFSQAEGEYYFEEVPIHITKSAPLLAEISTDVVA